MRVVMAVIAAGAVLGSVATQVVAQESLPGVVSVGRYAEGTLAVARQAAPAGAATGSVYGVGPWPTYTSALADGEGRDLVVGACSICHSTTYITMQPALPAAAWTATVDKMIKVFGASISDDTAKQITQYLQTHYTPETRR
jgi:mono/diheme cytochrome c family protein